MGNKQTAEEKEAASEALIVELEKNMIRHSGLPYESFKIHNVPVDREGNTVRTYEVGNE